jgi:hypothetical protein
LIWLRTSAAKYKIVSSSAKTAAVKGQNRLLPRTAKLAMLRTIFACPIFACPVLVVMEPV